MMSSKIVKIYTLTEYRIARMIAVLWPRLHCRATSANAANTSGFRVKTPKANQRSVQSASRLTGISREKQTEKNQSEGSFSKPTRLKSKAKGGDGSGLRSRVTRLKVACPSPTRRCRHYSRNRVGKRLPNVCVYPVLLLHLSLAHLQFCQLKNSSLLSCRELLPIGSGEIRCGAYRFYRLGAARAALADAVRSKSSVQINYNLSGEKLAKHHGTANGAILLSGPLSTNHICECKWKLRKRVDNRCETRNICGKGGNYRINGDKSVQTLRLAGNS
jgi:hypothetical protein